MSIRLPPLTHRPAITAPRDSSLTTTQVDPWRLVDLSRQLLAIDAIKGRTNKSPALEALFGMANLGLTHQPSHRGGAADLVQIPGIDLTGVLDTATVHQRGDKTEVALSFMLSDQTGAHIDVFLLFNLCRGQLQCAVDLNPPDAPMAAAVRASLAAAR